MLTIYRKNLGKEKVGDEVVIRWAHAATLSDGRIYRLDFGRSVDSDAPEVESYDAVIARSFVDAEGHIRRDEEFTCPTEFVDASPEEDRLFSSLDAVKEAVK